MSYHTLLFSTLDVFTQKLFSGNPLAIVHLPATLPPLSQAGKQLLAREFNFSETVFLHESPKVVTDRWAVIKIDIFTPSSELPFAGHPTIGTAWYLKSGTAQLTLPFAIALETRAGLIPVQGSMERVSLEVPVDYAHHGTVCLPELSPKPLPVVSIVKGMAFVLQETPVAGLSPLKQRVQLPDEFRASMGEWNKGFVGVYAFEFRENADIEDEYLIGSRMFDGPVEDPATGSAASALCAWLATERLGVKDGVARFKVTQGKDMGRESEISVTVEVGGGEVVGVGLSGSSKLVMEGRIKAPMEWFEKE